MRLDEEDRRWLEALIDEKLKALGRQIGAAIRPPLPVEVPMPRLTVEQFAIATELHVETIRLKIRVRQIPRELVFGERPKKISPKALELFGVTPQEARARLEARNRMPTSLRSAA